MIAIRTPIATNYLSIMSTVQNTHSHIFTNRDGNTLMKEFEGVLQNNPQIRNLDAVVGFLRASGYFSLRPFLDNIGKVRVLIGIEVDKYIAQAARQGKLFFGAEEEEVKEDCLRKIRKDMSLPITKKKRVCNSFGRRVVRLSMT